MAKIKTLPEVLRESLTWDQGPEMGKWNQVAVDADIDIFSAIRMHLGNAPRMKNQWPAAAIFPEEQ